MALLSVLVLVVVIIVVLLLFGYEWSMSEVAELLGVTKATVQSYSDRALVTLRRKLGVKR